MRTGKVHIFDCKDHFGQKMLLVESYSNETMVNLSHEGLYCVSAIRDYLVFFKHTFESPYIGILHPKPLFSYSNTYFDLAKEEARKNNFDLDLTYVYEYIGSSKYFPSSAGTFIDKNKSREIDFSFYEKFSDISEIRNYNLCYLKNFISKETMIPLWNIAVSAGCGVMSSKFQGEIISFKRNHEPRYRAPAVRIKK